MWLDIESVGNKIYEWCAIVWYLSALGLGIGMIVFMIVGAGMLAYSAFVGRLC